MGGQPVVARVQLGHEIGSMPREDAVNTQASFGWRPVVNLL